VRRNPVPQAAPLLARQALVVGEPVDGPAPRAAHAPVEVLEQRDREQDLRFDQRRRARRRGVQQDRVVDRDLAPLFARVQPHHVDDGAEALLGALVECPGQRARDLLAQRGQREERGRGHEAHEGVVGARPRQEPAVLRPGIEVGADPAQDAAEHAGVAALVLQEARQFLLGVAAGQAPQVTLQVPDREPLEVEHQLEAETGRQVVEAHALRPDEAGNRLKAVHLLRQEKPHRQGLGPVDGRPGEALCGRGDRHAHLSTPGSLALNRPGAASGGRSGAPSRP
jgi:hypothetical protein